MDVDLEGDSKFNCVALSPSPKLLVAASTGALWSRESISLPAISLVALFQWKWCIKALDNNENCARRSCRVYIWSFDAAVCLNSRCINCQVGCNLQTSAAEYRQITLSLNLSPPSQQSALRHVELQLWAVYRVAIRRLWRFKTSTLGHGGLCCTAIQGKKLLIAVTKSARESKYCDHKYRATLFRLNRDNDGSMSCDGCSW